MVERRKVVVLSRCDECPHHAMLGSESECVEMSRMLTKRDWARDFPSWCPLADEENCED